MPDRRLIAARHAARCVAAWTDDMLEAARSMRWPAALGGRLCSAAARLVEAEHDRRCYAQSGVGAAAGELVSAFVDLHVDNLRCLLDGSAGPETAKDTPARLLRSMASLEWARRAAEPEEPVDWATRQTIAEITADLDLDE